MALSPSRRKAIEEFALQILNTTIAVLIALAFGGLVDWRHERRQVADARAQMDAELRDNLKDAAAMESMIARSQAGVSEQIVHADGLLAARRAGTEASAVKKPRQGFYSFSEVFGASSRATAEASGALAHMNYGDLKRYASAYEYQQHVTRTLERLSDQFLAINGVLETGLAELDVDHLRAARGEMLTLRMLLTRLAGQRELLVKFYQQALGVR
jgi:hypothetical protein